MRYVISADDLGASPGVTARILEAADAGLLTSVSAIATGVAVEDGVREAQRRGLRVSLHLNKRLSLKHAAYIMVVAWTFSLIMAALPLVGVSDYRKFAVCLPFETEGAVSLGYVVFLMFIIRHRHLLRRGSGARRPSGCFSPSWMHLPRWSHAPEVGSRTRSR